MKRIWRNWLPLGCLAILLLIAGTGCNKASDSSSNKDLNWQIEDEAKESDSDEETSVVPTENVSGRKLVITIHYGMEVLDLDQCLSDLQKRVDQLDGYVEHSEVIGNTQDGGKAILTLRIPSEDRNEMTTFLENLGNVHYQTQKGEDVTAKYYDTETRLQTLRIQQERILELLNRADSLENILTLEEELTRIRTEIEKLTTELQQYERLVDYATIKVTLQQVEAYTEKTEASFWKRVGETLRNSFSVACGIVQELVLVFIWILPYLTAVALLVAVLLLYQKKRRKKK